LKALPAYHRPRQPAALPIGSQAAGHTHTRADRRAERSWAETSGVLPAWCPDRLAGRRSHPQSPVRRRQSRRLRRLGRRCGMVPRSGVERGADRGSLHRHVEQLPDPIALLALHFLRLTALAAEKRRRILPVRSPESPPRSPASVLQMRNKICAGIHCSAPLP